jgi:CRP/FNR family transcriptional regulator
MKSSILHSEREILSTEDFPGPVGVRSCSVEKHPRMATRRFRRGSLLFLEGDECGAALFINSGRVKLYADHRSGRSTILAVAGPGEIVGAAATLTGRPHEVTAEGLEAGDALLISRCELLRRMAGEDGFALRLAQQLSRDYLHLRDRFTSVSGPDPVIIRLARLLNAWAANGERSRPGLTHQEIAEIIGTSRETITRSFKELRCSGVATLRNGEFIVHDPARLRHLAESGSGIHE